VEIERADRNAVAPGHEQGERSPPATGFDHPFTRLEKQLAAHQIHLGRLSLLQRPV
jgi:hypothetical protein